MEVPPVDPNSKLVRIVFADDYDRFTDIPLDTLKKFKVLYEIYTHNNSGSLTNIVSVNDVSKEIFDLMLNETQEKPIDLAEHGWELLHVAHEYEYTDLEMRIVVFFTSQFGTKLPSTEDTKLLTVMEASGKDSFVQTAVVQLLHLEQAIESKDEKRIFTVLTYCFDENLIPYILETPYGKSQTAYIYSSLIDLVFTRKIQPRLFYNFVDSMCRKLYSQKVDDLAPYQLELVYVHIHLTHTYNPESFQKLRSVISEKEQQVPIQGIKAQTVQERDKIVAEFKKNKTCVDVMVTLFVEEKENSRYDSKGKVEQAYEHLQKNEIYKFICLVFGGYNHDNIIFPEQMEIFFHICKLKLEVSIKDDDVQWVFQFLEARRNLSPEILVQLALVYLKQAYINDDKLVIKKMRSIVKELAPKSINYVHILLDYLLMNNMYGKAHSLIAYFFAGQKDVVWSEKASVSSIRIVESLCKMGKFESAIKLGHLLRRHWNSKTEFSIKVMYLLAKYNSPLCVEKYNKSFYVIPAENRNSKEYVQMLCAVATYCIKNDKPFILTRLKECMIDDAVEDFLPVFDALYEKKREKEIEELLAPNFMSKFRLSYLKASTKHLKVDDFIKLYSSNMVQDWTSELLLYTVSNRLNPSIVNCLLATELRPKNNNFLNFPLAALYVEDYETFEKWYRETKPESNLIKELLSLCREYELKNAINFLIGACYSDLDNSSVLTLVLVDRSLYYRSYLMYQYLKNTRNSYIPAISNYFTNELTQLGL